MRHSDWTSRFAAAALLASAAAFQGAGPAAAEGDRRCSCRYAGQSFEQGACLCIVTPGGRRFACCEKVLNNSSWSFKDEPCPTSSVPRPPAAGVEVAEVPGGR